MAASRAKSGAAVRAVSTDRSFQASLRTYEPQSATLDTSKAFESLEGDVLRLQIGIDRMQNVAKQRKDLAVYRGRLASKRNLHPISRLLSSLSGEITTNLPQTRSFCMSESLGLLISSSLGPTYVKSSMDSLLRLAILKAQLLELVVKKVGELALLYLWMRVDEEDIGRLSGSVEIWVRCLEVLGAEERRSEGENALNRAEEQLRNQTKALENVRKELENAQKASKQQLIEHEAIKNRVEEQVRAQAKALESARKELENAQKDSKQQQIAYETRLKSLKEEMAQVQEAKAETRKEPTRRSLFTQTEDYQAELEQQRDTICRLQRETDTVLSRNKELEARQKQLESELSAAQQSYNTEHEIAVALRAKVKSAESEAEEKTSEVSRLRDIVMSLELETAKQAALCQRLQGNSQEQAAELAKKWEIQLDLQAASAQKTETCLTAQLSQELQQSSQLRALLDQKELKISTLTENKEQLEGEIRENEATIDRLQRSLSQLINMDEDTFEAVMKHEMEMMRSAYEQRLKDLRDSYDRLKRDKMIEGRALKEALAEKERVLELISSKSGL